MKKGMEVGDIFTVERDVCASTGTNYFLLHLEGGIALVETYLLKSESSQPEGAPAKKVFMFQCIRPGKAAIQFGQFRASDPSNIIYEQVLPIHVQANTINQDGIVCGGWSEFRELSETEKELFDKATKGIMGVGYEPLQVSTQVVAGINYRFYCNATSVTNPPKFHLAQVTIFDPLPGRGEPYVTSIVQILEKIG